MKYRYIDAEKLKEIADRVYKQYEYDYGLAAAGSNMRWIYDAIDSLQQEHPKSCFVKVKCIFPNDDSWEQDKVYTCEIWHHGGYNITFFDVYYDYGNNPKYVQFSSLSLLNKEFVIINEEEQPECSSSLVDVDAVREDFMAEVYHVLSADPTNDRANAIIKAFDSLPTVSPQEQPNVDLEKEILDWIGDEDSCKNGKWTWYECNKMIRHFYKRGLNARKEEIK